MFVMDVESGDIFSYIMEKYKISFTEAMELLAAEANIEFNIKLNSQVVDQKKSKTIII